MRNIILLAGISLCLFSVFQGHAYAEKIEPPWCAPPSGGIDFTVAGIDNVPDLHGDIVQPDLVVFFAGNQFMVVPDLIDSFKAQYPQYKRVFVETLPPGILARQIDEGSLVIGNMRITLTPDIFTAGAGRIKALQKSKDLFDKTAPYAENRLAIMVYKGNPEKIVSLKDLGRDDLRISMPNPQWEGIGNQILKAYNTTGGKQLTDQIMVKKVQTGTTFLTHIHHRQTPVRIMKKESDAGPVWYTEGYFQQMIGNPIEMVAIPEKDNVVSRYVAGTLKNAPHKQAAADFLEFLTSDKARTIYEKYGFLPVNGQPAE